MSPDTSQWLFGKKGGQGHVGEHYNDDPLLNGKGLGQGAVIPRVFNLSPALGTGGFGAATTAPACWEPVALARSLDFLIWAPSAPLWDVCPDAKALRGAAGMFHQELETCLGIYRLGP